MPRCSEVTHWIHPQTGECQCGQHKVEIVDGEARVSDLLPEGVSFRVAKAKPTFLAIHSETTIMEKKSE
jgi:hypothetical protein